MLGNGLHLSDNLLNATSNQLERSTCMLLF